MWEHRYQRYKVTKNFLNIALTEKNVMLIFTIDVIDIAVRNIGFVFN